MYVHVCLTVNIGKHLTRVYFRPVFKKTARTWTIHPYGYVCVCVCVCVSRNMKLNVTMTKPGSYQDGGMDVKVE